MQPRGLRSRPAGYAATSIYYSRKYSLLYTTGWIGRWVLNVLVDRRFCVLPRRVWGCQYSRSLSWETHLHKNIQRRLISLDWRHFTRSSGPRRKLCPRSWRHVYICQGQGRWVMLGCIQILNSCERFNEPSIWSDMLTNKRPWYNESSKIY